jgi:hypothetical protein
MVDVASLAWTQFLSLFDLGNPFSVYFWVMCLALFARAVLVLFPLKQIYNRWRNKDPKAVTLEGNFLNRVKTAVPFKAQKARNRLVKSLNNKNSRLVKFFRRKNEDLDLRVRYKTQREELNQVLDDSSITALNLFIRTEIIIAIAPAIVALTARIALGSPSVYDWTKLSRFLLAGIFVLWLVYQIRRSYALREALEPLQRFYADPLLIKAGLGATIWSRKKLQHLSSTDVPELSDYPETNFESMTKLNDEGKTRPALSGIVNNAKQIGGLLSVAAKNTNTHLKQFTKDSAEYSKDKLDSTIKSQADNFLEEYSSPMLTIFLHMFWTLSPIIAIYSLNILLN